MKLKRKIQNPNRNIITNIGNQILGFILPKKRFNPMFIKFMKRFP
jgi:hypothetical protein